jgi:hypothetical protein
VCSPGTPALNWHHWRKVEGNHGGRADIHPLLCESRHRAGC